MHLCKASFCMNIICTSQHELGLIPQKQNTLGDFTYHPLHYLLWTQTSLKSEDEQPLKHTYTI